MAGTTEAARDEPNSVGSGVNWTNAIDPTSAVLLPGGAHEPSLLGAIAPALSTTKLILSFQLAFSGSKEKPFCETGRWGVRKQGASSSLFWAGKGARGGFWFSGPGKFGFPSQVRVEGWNFYLSGSQGSLPSLSSAPLKVSLMWSLAQTFLMDYQGGTRSNGTATNGDVQRRGSHHHSSSTDSTTSTFSTTSKASSSSSSNSSLEASDSTSLPQIQRNQDHHALLPLSLKPASRSQPPVPSRSQTVAANPLSLAPASAPAPRPRQQSSAQSQGSQRQASHSGSSQSRSTNDSLTRPQVRQPSVSQPTASSSRQRSQSRGVTPSSSQRGSNSYQPYSQRSGSSASRQRSSSSIGTSLVSNHSLNPSTLSRYGPNPNAVVSPLDPELGRSPFFFPTLSDLYDKIPSQRAALLLPGADFKIATRVPHQWNLAVVVRRVHPVQQCQWDKAGNVSVQCHPFDIVDGSDTGTSLSNINFFTRVRDTDQMDVLDNVQQGDLLLLASKTAGAGAAYTEVVKRPADIRVRLVVPHNRPVLIHAGRDFVTVPVTGTPPSRFGSVWGPTLRPKVNQRLEDLVCYRDSVGL
ncbi:hypothetical protein P7C70_g6823, partial [Phenoliferia sp. Uapishka_3]